MSIENQFNAYQLITRIGMIGQYKLN